ncbi:TPA: LuxR family transcriptional regulator [Escherichia coli]|uniref:LuxR family transcriptional regulator n=1 Tax=Escherichia coli TaxID=562 RepID=UPI000E1FE071|nr:LuxR family transcriptional regulator [Escherichia coli]EEW6403686.1 LuxR family transcriptional regulator [Escherichia coli]EHX8372731.1 LuxR family transcriptional regulator [Escherichia coli]MCB4448740.1 LuxR family transcriptional regulator [Escherichia coli]HCP2228419.1 LuxR family transcriptional regulator [Escherichia coli]
MKNSLVIISACQYTQLALMNLLPEENYCISCFLNVDSKVESILKGSCGYVLIDNIPSLSAGEQVLLACILRLRNKFGQWLVCLTGDLDKFEYSSVSKLYNGYHFICSMMTIDCYRKYLLQWLMLPLPGKNIPFKLLTFRELEILKVLMQGRSLSEVARYEQRSLKTLHTIAVQALVKLEIDTINDFKLLYTGCG